MTRGRMLSAPSLGHVPCIPQLLWWSRALLIPGTRGGDVAVPCPLSLSPGTARPCRVNLASANCISSAAEINKLLLEWVLVKAGWRPGLAHPGEHP